MHGKRSGGLRHYQCLAITRNDTQGVAIDRERGCRIAGIAATAGYIPASGDDITAALRGGYRDVAAAAGIDRRCGTAEIRLSRNVACPVNLTGTIRDAGIV